MLKYIYVVNIKEFINLLSFLGRFKRYIFYKSIKEFIKERVIFTVYKDNGSFFL